MNSIFSGIQKETIAFIVGGCFLIGISTQFGEPYRIVTFGTGLVLIPLAFVWNYMESRLKSKERLELQQRAKEQIERMKIRCPQCGQKVIPKKVGETFLCPNCNHQFKSTKQRIEEWEKGFAVASEIIDFLDSL